VVTLSSKTKRKTCISMRKYRLPLSQFVLLHTLVHNYNLLKLKFVAFFTRNLF